MDTSLGGVTEIILPSGRFARIRPIKGRDFLESQEAIKQGKDMLFVLVTLCATIDDAPLTYDQVLDMDVRDLMEITKTVSGFLTDPIRNNPT